MISGFLLTHLRRPMGRMTVTEQKLEGEFRYINSRLITNSEEVAFYQGNHREKLTMLTSFQKLVNKTHNNIFDFAIYIFNQSSGYSNLIYIFCNKNSSETYNILNQGQFSLKILFILVQR